MANLSFKNAQLNKLFPFHIVLDPALYIESASDAITKIFGEITGQSFNDLFLLDRFVSESGALTADHLKTLITQPIKMYRASSSALAFIADVEYFPSNGKFLITGTPSLHNTPETVNIRNTDDMYSESETSAQVLPPEIVNESSNNRALLTEFASLRKLSAVAEDNINGIVLTDQEGKIQWANRAFEITTGYQQYEILGKRPRDILYGPESVFVPVNFVDENVKKKVPFTFQNIGYTKQNVKFWFEALVHPIIDKHNNIIGRFSSLRDITQLKEKEKELEINHQLLNSALESSGYGVWIFEYSDGTLKLSDQCKKILGYGTNDELTIRSLKAMINAEDLDRSLQNIVLALSTLRPEFSTEWRIKCKNTAEKYFLVKGSITSWNELGAPCRIVGTISDINDLKQKDIELELTAKRLSILLENLNEAILLEDEDRKILLINPSFCHIFSIPLSPAQLIGADCSNAAEQSKFLFRHPEEFVERIENLLNRKIKVAEEKLEMADGRILSRDFIPIHVDGQYKGHLWKYKDITLNISQENKVIAQKDYYQRILNEIPADIVILNHDHQFEFINKNAVKDDTLRHWLLGKTNFDYCRYRGIDIQFAEKREALFQQAVTSRLPIRTKDKFIKKDGSTEYMLRILNPHVNASGHVDFVISYGIDITDQEDFKNQLQVKTDYYNTILNEIPADIVVFNLEHKYEFINKNAIRDNEIRKWMIGKDDYDYCKLRNLDITLADGRRRTFHNSVNSKQPQKIIDEHVKPNGTSEFILRIIYPFLNEHGEVSFVIGYGIDVTEQILSKRAAEVQEKRISNMMQIIKDGVFRCDEDGTINLCNNSFKEILNISADARLKKANFFELIPPEEATALKNCITILNLTGNPQNGSFYLQNNGKKKYIDYTFTLPLKSEDAAFVGRISDVTDRITREQHLNDLIEQEKELSNSKSRFIHITSHELRTPLALIQANAEIAEMILAQYPKNEETPDPAKMITRITKEVMLMTEILNQLMTISKIEAGSVAFEPQSVNIVEFLTSLKEDLYAPYSDGRQLTLDISPEIHLILCDKKLLRHAIVNLVNNAFKYSQAKPAPILRLHQTDEDFIFDVQDYGIGIPDADKSKLFTSFFRASNVGVIQGTGLGLMVIEYAVQKHGGKIQFQTKLNEGSTFIFSLPKNNIQ